ALLSLRSAACFLNGKSWELSVHAVKPLLSAIFKRLPKCPNPSCRQRPRAPSVGLRPASSDQRPFGVVHVRFYEHAGLQHGPMIRCDLASALREGVLSQILPSMP